MALKQVNDDVTQRLYAMWTHQDIVPIVLYDTIREPPPGVQAFVVIHFPVSNGFRPTLGRLFFEEGTIRLILNVMQGMGLDQVLTWTDELAAIFREQTFGRVECKESSGPVITNDLDDGQWVGYSIVIRYRHQYYG